MTYPTKQDRFLTEALVRRVVAFVAEHPECTLDDIEAGMPGMTHDQLRSALSRARFVGYLNCSKRSLMRGPDGRGHRILAKYTVNTNVTPPVEPRRHKPKPRLYDIPLIGDKLPPTSVWDFAAR